MSKKGVMFGFAFLFALFLIGNVMAANEAYNVSAYTPTASSVVSGSTYTLNVSLFAERHFNASNVSFYWKNVF